MYGQRNDCLTKLINPIAEANYIVDVGFSYLEEYLINLNKDAELEGGRLLLNPDFQRGHVWEQHQQIKYIENVFRGLSPIDVTFNQGGWMDWSDNNTINENKDVVCVDGLQRITAIREFLNKKFTIFGCLSVNDLDGSRYSIKRSSYRLKFKFHSIRSRKELLKLYIDLNSGGTPHSLDEIKRIKKLISC